MSAPQEKPTWIEILLPIIIILGLAALAMIWNIIAGVAILFVGLAIWAARFVQRHEPREPGE